MKTIIPFVMLAIIITAYVSCSSGKVRTESAMQCLTIEDAADDGLQCEQYFYYDNTAELPTQIMCELADVCNAYAILHAVMSDMECWVRMDMDVSESIMRADLGHIADATLRRQVGAYVREMNRLASAEASDEQLRYESLQQAWSLYNELDSIIATGHHVTRYGALNDSLYWSRYDKQNIIVDYGRLEQSFGTNDSELVAELQSRIGHAANIDERCVLSLSLAHVNMETDDSGVNSAANVLLDCLRSGEYSIYLYEVWRTWRSMLQLAMGCSKDSELCNQYCNSVRMLCLHSIMNEIERTGGDIFAVNEFLALSSENNILRYGCFPFGNQNVVEYYELFPEQLSESECADDGHGMADPMMMPWGESSQDYIEI